MKKTILALSTIGVLSIGSVGVRPMTAVAAASSHTVTISLKYPGHEIRVGSRGTYVKDAQEQLNKLGYSCGTADGVFGAQTLQAVKSFQRAHGLTVDGVIGLQTWNTLFTSSNTLSSKGSPSGSGTGNHSGVSWAKQNSYVFNDSFLKFVKSRHDRVSVAVYDANTGQTYTYNPNAVYCTASIVKVTLMTTLLYKDQVAHKPISAAQNRLLVPMIEDSDNEAASDIWNQLGRGK
jgi:hypothetical protein